MLAVPLMSMALVDLRGEDLAQATGLSNIMRQLGGAIGVVVVNIYVQYQDAMVHNTMISYITPYSQISTQHIAYYQSMFSSLGNSSGNAPISSLFGNREKYWVADAYHQL